MIDNKIKELKIDEWIWVIFIILSILNIWGDECEKDYYFHQEELKDETAKKIFTFTVFISLCIYLYLLYQRYQKVKMAKILKEDANLCEVRLFGSILVVIATILFLYCQVEEHAATNPSIV